MAHRHVRLRGLALIEMALVLPLLVLLVFAVIEYGWAFVKSGEVVNAARHGARVGVRADATTADVQNAVLAMMTNAGMGSGYTLVIDPDDVALPEVGENLTVTITIPYADIALTGLRILPVPTRLRAEVTMAKEGA